MNKLIEAKAFQIGEYWYICARLPLEEGVFLERRVKYIIIIFLQEKQIGMEL